MRAATTAAQGVVAKELGCRNIRAAVVDKVVAGGNKQIADWRVGVKLMGRSSNAHMCIIHMLREVVDDTNLEHHVEDATRHTEILHVLLLTPNKNVPTKSANRFQARQRGEYNNYNCSREQPRLWAGHIIQTRSLKEVLVLHI